MLPRPVSFQSRLIAAGRHLHPVVEWVTCGRSACCIDQAEGTLRSTHEEGVVQPMTQGGVVPSTDDDGKIVAAATVEQSASQPPERDSAITLAGCERIVIVGRTGSGKTTLARELAAALDLPHVEFDALYFGPKFSTAPLSVLRERTSAAIAGARWVADGNKSAVRDLVWPRADTIIWLDYPLAVSFWRLGRRALGRASTLQAQAVETGETKGLPRQLLSAARGVLQALRSHMGQRREYPRMFTAPENQHLAVARLRSPRATRRWLARVVEDGAARR